MATDNTTAIIGEIETLLTQAKELGWDKKTLCSKSGVHRGTVDRWLAGTQQPTMMRFLSLKNAIEKEKIAQKKEAQQKNA